MTLLIKELSEAKKNKIIELIKEAGFKILHKGNTRIEFSKGYRFFTLNSTDTSDFEFGLTTGINLEKFLKDNFKEKPKHSISLKEQLYKKEKQESLNDIETAFKNLGWTVTFFYDSTTATLDKFNEDPLGDSLYEVSIRDLSHVVLEEDVFEGDIAPILALTRKKPQEIFEELNLMNVLEKIKKIK